MKLTGHLAVTLIFLCGCWDNSPTKTDSNQSLNSAAEAAALSSQEITDSEVILIQSLKMMRQDIEIFLHAGEYEAALMQIEHYRYSIDRLPSPTPEARDFRNGELYYYQAFCQVKTGEKEKARETLESGLKQCPAGWKERALMLLSKINTK